MQTLLIRICGLGMLLIALAVCACSQGAEGPITNILPTSAPATATPGPSPTPVPSPTPQGALFVQSSGGPTSSIVINFTTTGTSQLFTALETGYTKAFGIANTCGTGNVATLAPASGNGPSALFTLTSQNAGTCSVVISDVFGQTANVSVIVTTTTGSIQ